MKYEKPTIYNTAEQHKRIFDELSVAKAVIENNNELIADLSKKVERLQEQLKEANELLLDFCSKDECRFDHNGYCQEHDSCEGEYKCIQKDLKQYLERWGVK